MHPPTAPHRLASAAALAAVATLVVAGCQSADTDSRNGVHLSIQLGRGINEATVEAFNEVYPEIQVEVLTYPDDYSQKLHTMVVGGTAPDVMLLWEPDLLEFAANGVLAPLEDYLSASDAVELGDFIPAVSELVESTDGAFGLPWVYASELLFYNKDLFDAAGVEYPTEDWTWEDFRQAAIALTDTSANPTVWGTDTLNNSGVWYSMIGQAGDEVAADGQLAVGDGLQHTLEFWNDLTNVQQVAPEPTTGSSVADLFASGTAAMKPTGSWSISGYQDVEFNWDVAPLPGDVRDYTTLHTGFYTITEDSDQKDAAWKFIEFMMSPDGQRLTSEITGNPSAIQALADDDSWQIQGEHGPSNWDAFAQSAETGSFGYTLLNSTVTSNLINDFNSYLLGEVSLDDVTNGSVPAANQELSGS